MIRFRTVFVLVASFGLAGQASGAPTSRLPAGDAAPATPPGSRLPTVGSQASAHPRVRLPPPVVPVALTSTTDVQVCSQHGGFGGGLACKALLPTGALALVWNWPGGPNIDGFHVWRIDGGRRELVGTQPHAQSEPNVYSIDIIDTVPADGFAGKCYAVTAFGSAYAFTSGGASKDSPLSPEYCPPGNAVVSTQIFTPTQWFSVSKTSDVSTYENENYSTDFSVSDSSTTTVISNGLVANGGPAVGNLMLSALARTAILFDVSSLSRRHIRSARLRLTVDTSTVNASDSMNATTNHYRSCTDKVGTATDEGWQRHHDWIDASVVSSSIQQQGPDVAFDVTSIVDHWTHGDKNYGFTLFGEGDANTQETSPQDAGWTSVSPESAQTNCLTVYRPDNMVLEIQYQ